MNNSNKKANGLMGDLESIKALLEDNGLDDNELEAVPEALVPDLSQALNPPVPTLPEDNLTIEDDLVIQEPPRNADIDAVEFDAAELDEAAPILLDPLNSFDPKTGLSTPIGQPEADVAEAKSATSSAASAADPTSSLTNLLSQEFHSATAAALSSARAVISANPNNWSPQQTDELADALRVRIDGAVEQWIQTSLAAHAGELQQHLLNAVRDELAYHLDGLQSTPDA